MTGTPKMTSRDVLRALWWNFTPRWAMLTEVTARAQYAPPTTDQLAKLAELGAGWRPARTEPISSERRIDVLLLRGANVTGGIERMAVEVKVTRGDFLLDVRNPDKQAPWRGLAHRHAYAVPEGLVAETEVPAGSGLLVIKPSQYAGSGFTVRWARLAKKPAGHDPGPLPLANVMDAFWRAGRGEAQIKGHGGRPGSDAENDADALRAQLARLTAENKRLQTRIDQAVEQKQRWQAAFGALGQPACGTCGKPLRLARARRRSYGVTGWEHADEVDQEMCKILRHAKAIEENNARPEKQRRDEEYVWVPDPEPADLHPAEDAR